MAGFEVNKYYIVSEVSAVCKHALVRLDTWDNNRQAGYVTIIDGVGRYNDITQDHLTRESAWLIAYKQVIHQFKTKRAALAFWKRHKESYFLTSLL